MKRATIFALGWLVFTVGILVFHTGCGSAVKPSAAKPEPRQTQSTGYSCLRVEREAKSEIILCGSADVCQHAHDKLVAYWPELEKRYGTTGLSDCVTVTAEFTERK